MTNKELNQLRKIAEDATPGPWGPWSGNYPFYVMVKKPAPSLSKHDHERGDFWRYQDGEYVLAFNPKVALELLNRISDLEEVLEGKRSFTRELDVALNGEDAADQASLCDIVRQGANMKIAFDRAMQGLRMVVCSLQDKSSALYLETRKVLDEIDKLI
jgi:hypothetical protein